MPASILLRTEASEAPNVGTGHLRRQMHLARALRRKGGRVLVVADANRLARRLLREGRVPHRVLPNHGRGRGAWNRILREASPDVVVFDRWTSRQGELRRAKKEGSRVLLLDDVRDVDHADIRVNALLANRHATHAGPRYLMLGPVQKKKRVFPAVARTLVVSFGGHDAKGMMPGTLRMLAKDNPFEKVWCFCAERYRKDKAFQALQRSLDGRVKIFFDDPRLSRFLAKADMGLVAAGLTLYEALAGGLPCLVMGQNRHQRLRMRALAAKGVLVNIGEGASQRGVLRALRRLRADSRHRRNLSRRARRLVDGEGFNRVRDLVWQLTKQ